MMIRLLLPALLALPLAAQGAGQCTLFPDVAVYSEPSAGPCSAHAVMTNISDVWADVVVRFHDARHGGAVELTYRIAPRRKAKLNLEDGPDHAVIMEGAGTRPPDEHWFVDGYMEVVASGGDVRTVLELQRGGLPVRTYGMACASRAAR